MLEVCEPGSPEPADLAPGADVRTGVSGYRVWPSGELATPEVHGAPVHAGDPAELGIADLGAPDHGDPVELRDGELRDGELPVFWACGVTPQAPGHMFVTDRPER